MASKNRLKLKMTRLLDAEADGTVSVVGLLLLGFGIVAFMSLAVWVASQHGPGVALRFLRWIVP